MTGVKTSMRRDAWGVMASEGESLNEASGDEGTDGINGDLQVEIAMMGMEQMKRGSEDRKSGVEGTHSVAWVEVVKGPAANSVVSLQVALRSCFDSSSNGTL